MQPVGRSSVRHAPIVNLPQFHRLSRDRIILPNRELADFNVNEPGTAALEIIDANSPYLPEICPAGNISFIVNRSVNDTLSRTMLTSGTTLLVVLSLFVLGGGVIHNFAFAMLIGVLVGTYSSIFVASPILIYWDQRKLKKS